jgi:hypothetical protein
MSRQLVSKQMKEKAELNARAYEQKEEVKCSLQ